MEATDGLAIRTVNSSASEAERLTFSEFYTSHRDAAYRAVLVATRNPQRAEDAVQEAFLRAYHRWDEMQHHDRPHAWVIRVALNIATSWWRRHRREQTDPPDRPAPPDSHPMDGELVRLLWQLPKRQRQVVALRILADLSVADTGRMLDMAEGTVKATLHRGLRRLRDTLEPDGGER